jgi:integrase
MGSKFTDRFIDSLQSRDKEYCIREGHGFTIRVLSSGVKTFQYIYTLRGKRRRMNLGNYSTTTLKDARKKYLDAAKQVADGIDPQEEKTISTPIPEVKTVSDVAKEFLENWSKKYYSTLWHYNVELALKNDVLPVIGSRVISTIRRREIISLLDVVVARAPGQARNVHKALSKMFWYAKKHREYIDSNPCTDMLDSIPALRVAEGKTRTLDDKEIKKLWSRIDRGPGSDSVKRALKLVLVTAQRPEEVAELHSREIEIGVGKPRCQLCRRCGWWTIPWERIKTENSETLKRTREDHRVYLSPLAMSLIGDMKGFIFPSATGEEPIRRNSLSQRVKRGISTHRNGKKRQFEYYGLPGWGPHDLRRSARTGMAKIEVPKDWAEEVLNHKDKKIRSIYDQHKYDAQKKKALTKWAEHLESIIN